MYGRKKCFFIFSFKNQQIRARNSLNYALNNIMAIAFYFGKINRFFISSRSCLPVHCDEEAVVVPRARDDPDLVEEEGADAGGGRAQGGVDDGGGHGDAVAVAGDGALLGPVAGEEAKHQDQAAQGRQGHRVAGHRNLGIFS